MVSYRRTCDMAEEDVEVRFGATLEGLQSGIEAAKEQLEEFVGPVTALRDSFGELAEAAAAAFAFEKIAEFLSEMGEAAERTERAAVIFGITAKQVGELEFAMKMSGAEGVNLQLV